MSHHSVENAKNDFHSLPDTYQKPHSFSAPIRLSSVTSDFVNKNRTHAFSMKQFPLGLFPSGETINVREKPHSLVWHTFNPTIHPIHNELGATQIPHYPPSSSILASSESAIRK